MLEKKWIDYLKKQKESKFVFEDVNKLELLHLLMEHIGEKDAEIRDGLVYPNLAHLLNDKHFDEDQLNDIATDLISEQYLTFDIENYVDYSVLTRSFSVLQLAVLVHVHNRDHVIHGKIIQNLFTKFLKYFTMEEDLRGYNEEVGFMHSIAHSADLFAQLMQVEFFHEKEIKTMFTVIIDKYQTKDFFFMYDEDERMVNAIMNGLQREILDQEFIEGWIDSFANYKKPKNWPQAYYITNNVKVFLRSLYFRVLDHEKYGFVAEKIKKVLQEKVKLH
jgi:hypothetical protein